MASRERWFAAAIVSLLVLVAFLLGWRTAMWTTNQAAPHIGEGWRDPCAAVGNDFEQATLDWRFVDIYSGRIVASGRCSP